MPDNNDKLSGTQRAAVLLMSLGEAEAAEVLRQLNAKEVQKLGVAMATISNVTKDQVIEVVDEFVEDLQSQTAFGLGADDYVPKPCTPRELAARLRAILKRVQAGKGAGAETAQERVVGQLQLWPGKRRAAWRGQALELTSTEFSLLDLLARHAGQPVSKETLSQEALGRPLTRFDRSIDVHISGIRQKLGQLPDGSSPIETVIRQGYMLVLP